MELLTYPAAPLLRPTAFDLAVGRARLELSRADEPSAARCFEPIVDATGIPNLFPMTVRSNGSERTILVNRRGDGNFVVVTRRPSAVSAPDEAAVLERVRADVVEHVLPLVAASPYAPGDIDVRWLVDHIYAFEAGGATYLTYATFDRELRRIGMTYGPGFGAVERRLAHAPLVLPIAPALGSYVFYAGGDSIVSNPHFVSRDMRYAVDMIPLDGESQIVVAPADGIVVDAADGHDDLLARRDPQRSEFPAGNFVRVRSSGLWFWFLHLRKGSVAVKSGDRVSVGQGLGHIGDSGRSAEPHLHFHVSTAEGVAHGVPLRFRTGLGAWEPRRGACIAQFPQ